MLVGVGYSSMTKKLILKYSFDITNMIIKSTRSLCYSIGTNAIWE